MKAIRIHPLDNVAVAMEPIAKGETVTLEDGVRVTALQDIQRGHKIALSAVSAGEPIRKYGCAIGLAKTEIAPGDWVHTHNVRTGLSEDGDYVYCHKTFALPSVTPRTFQGFRRADGRCAIRNEIWILPTVGCVNSIAQRLVRENQHLVSGSVEGLYTFPHPFGCSQMGDDHAQTRRLLAALARHPNAGGVLVLGLGCENLTMEQFQTELGTWDDRRVKFLSCQDVEDEMQAGAALLEELAGYAGTFTREAIPHVNDAKIGRASFTWLSCERRKDRKSVVQSFKNYFTSHGQVVYENPSPGNKAGGITTLEDKSCGCVQKGGSAQIVDVLEYGQAVTKKGLNLLSGPGNDLVSATDLTAAGAHLILFTTGRGTPFGAPAPTVKISTNTALFEKKPGWIDFNAGTVAQGESLDSAADRLLDFVLKVASGTQTRAEENGFREISIFKDGVVL